MTIQNLIDDGIFTCVNAGDDTGREISKPFCCDLLSIAMSKAPADSCWVTIMANMNTLAVASLTEVGCVVLAEGCVFDENCINKAKMQGITVFATDLPIFDAALEVMRKMECC